MARPDSTAAMLELRETDTVETMLALLVAEHTAAIAAAPTRAAPLATLLARIAKHRTLDQAQQAVSPFDRMQHARDALNYLDTVGWKRSYHQRLFHEDFLVRLLKVVRYAYTRSNHYKIGIQ